MLEKSNVWKKDVKSKNNGGRTSMHNALESIYNELWTKNYKFLYSKALRHVLNLSNRPREAILLILGRFGKNLEGGPVEIQKIAI